MLAAPHRLLALCAADLKVACEPKSRSNNQVQAYRNCCSQFRSRKSRAMRVQAADLPGIEQHVQEVCSTLAARLFDAKATPCTTGVQGLPKQVRLYASMTRFEALVGALSQMPMLLHPVSHTQALARHHVPGFYLPTVERFITNESWLLLSLTISYFEIIVLCIILCDNGCSY
jgi:hypothetical protein